MSAAAEGNANCFLEKKRKLLPSLPIDHKMKLFDKMSAIMSFPEAPQCFSFRLQIFQICLWLSKEGSRLAKSSNFPFSYWLYFVWWHEMLRTKLSSKLNNKAGEISNESSFHLVFSWDTPTLKLQNRFYQNQNMNLI